MSNEQLTVNNEKRDKGKGGKNEKLEGVKNYETSFD
jgi:hypothetical protein